jgi:hypothetical protein
LQGSNILPVATSGLSYLLKGIGFGGNIKKNTAKFNVSDTRIEPSPTRAFDSYVINNANSWENSRETQQLTNNQNIESMELQNQQAWETNALENAQGIAMGAFKGGKGLLKGIVGASFGSASTALSNNQRERSVDLANKQSLESLNLSITQQQGSLRATPNGMKVPPYLSAYADFGKPIYHKVARNHDLSEA